MPERLRFESELSDLGFSNLVSKEAQVGPIVGGAKELPLILAGPIVRRATLEKVWFWFACSKKVKDCKPTIIPYDINGKNIYSSLPIKETILDASKRDFRVVRLGERIWIVLVSAVPKSGKFLSDCVLGYDLSISTEENGRVKTDKLSELDLKISYPPFSLPTFVIGEENRRLVHGSCRRPGAAGEDAFGIYDELLAKNALDPQARPASLFLTGDQIYADDVNLLLFSAVSRIASDVFGYNEQIPNADGKGFAPASSYLPYEISKFPQQAANTSFSGWSDRKILTHRNTSPIGFTTDDGEAHLLSFAEYVAMYLAVWSPDLCRKYLLGTNRFMTLWKYADYVQACRRVMANTATYMLFDDHEITDDWNLDKQWEKTSKNNPLARRVIANGLAAYWAFQAWGNDPNMFGKEFVQTLSRYFEQLRTSKGNPGNAGSGSPHNSAAKYEETLLKKHWSFLAPSNPKALCVDIRTSRDFSQDGHVILSGEKVQPYLKALLTKHGFRKGETLLLVTPTPFLPHEAMMLGQAIKYKYPRERYEGDYELYADYPPQQAQFMGWLHDNYKPSAVVIFSGDVHHASVVSGRFAHGKTQNQIMFGKADWVIRIVQITSSPIKNRNDSKFIDPAWDGTVKGFNIRPFIDVFNPGIGILSRIDAGTIGRIAPRDYMQPFDVPGGVRLLQSKVRDLTGNLSSKTYIYENHLCVVDMPSQPKGDVKVLFVGLKEGKLETARISVDTDNDSARLKFTIKTDVGSVVKAGVLGGLGVKIPAPEIEPPPD